MSTNTTPWHRLDEELAMQRKTWKSLADFIGQEKQNVGNWKARGIPAKHMRRAAEFIGKSLDWLEFGDDLAQPTNVLANTSTSSIRSYSKPSKNEITITQYDTGGAMGHGVVLRDQPGSIEHFGVTPEWIQKNVPLHTGLANLKIVTGFGDSMLGMFNPGDPLLVDCGINVCDVDGVYFFRIGNEGFIKRLQRIPGEGIRAISTNKEYETWTIKPNMDFQVLAKVLRAWNGQNL